MLPESIIILKIWISGINHLFQIFRFQPWDLMKNGVAPLNAILVGSVVSSLYPLFFPEKPSLEMWIFICIGAFQRYSKNSKSWSFFLRA